MTDDTIHEAELHTNTAHKIQIAADLIADEMFKRGTPISLVDCLTIARRLHEIWERQQETVQLAPGEIAQRFRERYSD